ncbi:MAG: HAD family hydrolase [Limnochordia bacterium]|jgi:FMN phosphatase YigB (HAD superfamily)
MWHAVLFDLDDTLIIADNVRLMNAYFEDVTKRFPPQLSSETVRRQIVDSTLHIMAADDGRQLAIDRFAEHFFSSLGLPADMSVFEEYYREEYARLGRFARPARGAREALREALDLGLRVVLATNPVFPLEAIGHRLAWGGLEDIAWDLVTGLENMHYSKPQPGYYLEIARHLNLETDKCLMVGNDPANDLSAKLVGMQAFLVTGERPAVSEEEEEVERITTADAADAELLQLDASLVPAHHDLNPDYTGTLEDLRHLLRSQVGGFRA